MLGILPSSTHLSDFKIAESLNSTHLVGVRQTSGVRGAVNLERNRRKSATRKSDAL
jgi:hypothetical protein